MYIIYNIYIYIYRNILNNRDMYSYIYNLTINIVTRKIFSFPCILTTFSLIARTFFLHGSGTKRFTIFGTDLHHLINCQTKDILG